jgi:hypothetical protein
VHQEAGGLVAERLAAQQLSGLPAVSPEEVVSRLLAVQAQDPRAARLAVRSRSTGLTAADVDDALNRRALLITWLNRGTLHLIAAEDYWWLHPLTTPRLVSGNVRRLAQLGVSPERADEGVDVIVGAVRSEGHMTRSQLRHRLDAAGVPTKGQALVHLLFAASLRGHVVRGPVVAGEHAYVSVADWLGEPPPAMDPDRALATLARRYLVGHGPADATDLSKWAGVPPTAARRAIAAIAPELVPREDGRAQLGPPSGFVDLPPPRLLGGYDPILHGWASRELFVGSHQGVVTTNGLFRPTALVDGRVVATWGLTAGTVTIRPLEPIGEGTRAALQNDALDVLRFLGLRPRPAGFG